MNCYGFAVEIHPNENSTMNQFNYVNIIFQLIKNIIRSFLILSYVFFSLPFQNKLNSHATIQFLGNDGVSFINFLFNDYSSFDWCFRVVKWIPKRYWRSVFDVGYIDEGKSTLSRREVCIIQMNVNLLKMTTLLLLSCILLPNIRFRMKLYNILEQKLTSNFFRKWLKIITLNSISMNNY